MRFLVRVVSNLRRKARVVDDRNPFLPYETALHVADASPSHVCILNKYNVVDLHLLIITRHFEHQELPLNLADFEALWKCMNEYDALGFYNSGSSSGASQPHKHLQLVPLPLAAHEGRPSVPVELLLAATTTAPGHVGRSEHLPFGHALVHWPSSQWRDVERMAAASLACYREMLATLGVGTDAAANDRIATSYNLLVTRRWMLLVPRVLECFQKISLNALAFAGALLVSNRTQLARLRTGGPFAALESVTRPRS